MLIAFQIGVFGVVLSHHLVHERGGIGQVKAHVKSRVERWRGGLGNAYLLTGPFVCRCLTSAAIPRFHLPLIEPDVQISRIRLSDKVSRLRPREVARSSLEPDQPESAQVGFRVA